jgi:hypothetical protein
MIKNYMRLVVSRAARQAWFAVIAESWPDLGKKLLLGGAFLSVLYQGTRLGLEDAAFSDEIKGVLAGLEAAAVGATLLFLINLFVVAPYQLWREQKRRTDEAEAQNAQFLACEPGRIVAECLANGTIDYDTLREPMRRLIDPDREYNEEWQRLRLEEEIEKRRQIATAEEEARAMVQRRGRFRGRIGNRSVIPAEPKKPKWTDMPLHEVFRHVAFESKWAASYERFADADAECQADGQYALAKEVREALSRGDVNARGRHYIQGTDWGFTLASEPIPKEFWPNTYMQPFEEIALRDDARCIVTLVRQTNADPTDKYREIKLSREEVLAHWPRQRQAVGPLPPTQFSKDYVRELQRLSRRFDDEPEQ